MRFFDLGDNEYDLASPYRLFIPERGLDVEYETPGGILFASTNYGRAIFGLDGETRHEQLKGRLEPGEKMVGRGIMWPDLNAMVVWQLFHNMDEFRSFMGIVSKGLKGLGIDPSRMLLYMGYMHKAFDGNREYDSYNVEMSVSEACSVEGGGDVNDCLYKMFLARRKEQEGEAEDVDARTSWNGMRGRDLWRHYEVVGEGRRRTYKIRESGLKRIIKRLIAEEMDRMIGMSHGKGKD